MESDNSSDETTQQNVKSRIAFFKSLENTDGSKQTRRQVSAGRKGHTSATGLPKNTTTLRSAGAERSYSPRGNDTSSIWKEETDKVRRSGSPRKYSPSSFERKKPNFKRRFNNEAFDGELRARIKEASTGESSNFSPDELEVFQRPMCLVRTETGNKLIIDDETVKQIKKIFWPMIIVAVVGLYRTGKSYLMNRLAGLNAGFALGDTIESKTKGIWVWCRKHPEKPNTVLMLIDTEGLGDIDKGDPNHDNKIFTLATLLCNCLVYNMKGAFDQDAVNKLTFITEMSKNIRFRGNASETNEYLNLILPEFVLCVRDFSLKLVKGGKQITPDEYLEKSLEEKKEKGDKFNKPRECIRKYFAVRKCFTFPVPGDGDVLENLETLTFDELSPKFKEASCWFTTYIYSLKPKELLVSKPITGQMFIILASHYVTAIDHGAIPDVDDAFLATAKMENKRITENALNIFEECLATVKLPVPSRDLEVIYKRAQSETLKYLRDYIVLDNDGQYELDAQAVMDKNWNQLKEQNKKKIQDLCDEELQDVFIPMKEKINQKMYSAAGGHKHFQRDLDEMKSKYKIALRDFEEHETLWTWLVFMEEMKQIESEIIDADERMSEEEKKEERKRNEENIRKLNEEHEIRTQKVLEEQKKSMEEQYQKINKEREEKFEEEMTKYEDLVKTKLAKETAEKELKTLKEEQEKRKNRWFGGRMWDAFWNA